MAEYIDKEKLLEFCKKCADVARELESKCLDNIGHGDSFGGSFGAVAYFHQRVAMLEYEIPQVINSFLMEHGGGKKPLRGADFDGNEYKICPECCAIVEDGEWRADLCPDCGQMIDWSACNEVDKSC